MIVSAFPATGKTTLAAHHDDVLDSDSSGWSWSAPGVRHPDWPHRYVEHLDEVDRAYAVVLCSSHAEVRATMAATGVGFVLVYPARDLREQYVERLVRRGSPDSLVRLVRRSWHPLIDSCQMQQGCVHVVLGDGQYLSSVLKPAVVPTRTTRPARKEQPDA